MFTGLPLRHASITMQVIFSLPRRRWARCSFVSRLGLVISTRWQTNLASTPSSRFRVETGLIALMHAPIQSTSYAPRAHQSPPQRLMSSKHVWNVTLAVCCLLSAVRAVKTLLIRISRGSNHGSKLSRIPPPSPVPHVRLADPLLKRTHTSRSATFATGRSSL